MSILENTWDAHVIQEAIQPLHISNIKLMWSKQPSKAGDCHEASPYMSRQIWPHLYKQCNYAVGHKDCWMEKSHWWTKRCARLGIFAIIIICKESDYATFCWYACRVPQWVPPLSNEMDYIRVSFTTPIDLLQEEKGDCLTKVIPHNKGT